MPPRRNSSELAKLGPPPKTMTWAKALPVLSVALTFWALRDVFDMFWFFGPVIVAGITTAVASAHVGATAGTAAGAAAGAATAIYGDGVLEMLGLVMAIAVAFMGWLVVLLMIVMTNARLLKEQPGSVLWVLLGLGIAVLPFVGALPGILATTVKLYHTQIKKERTALRNYRRKAAALAKRERAAHAAELEASRAEAQAQQKASEEEAMADAAASAQTGDGAMGGEALAPAA